MRKNALRLFLIIFALYAAFNCLLIAFVPLVHHFTLEITVVDADSGSPVHGATVSWVSGNPLVEWQDPVGSTDDTGRVKNEVLIQEQPWWVYPRIGWFQFEQLILRVAKDGYETNTTPLVEAAPSVPYGVKFVPVTIRMSRKR